MNTTKSLLASGLFLALTAVAFPQTPGTAIAPLAASASTPVPPLVRYAGVAFDEGGKPLGHAVSVTFLIFKDERGGEPLWMETQSLAFDAAGRYAVELGATSQNGLPLELFASGEARWLEVQLAGQAPKLRTLLASAPYAMKAADAETLSGKAAADFVTRNEFDAAMRSQSAPTRGQTAPPMAAQPMTVLKTPTGTGSSGQVPLWTASETIGSSALFQSGSGSTARLGIGTTTPAATLDVNGTLTTHNTLEAISTAATDAAGVNSPLLELGASAFSSATKAAVPQRFAWQAAPTGNNTSSPSAALHLAFASGSASPAPTGLSISPKGVVSFAPGQTFPGAGTISGVAAGTGLTGGGSSGPVTLSLDTTKVVTAVTAGAGLTGGGTGGSQTLSVDATKVPLLSSPNTFTGSNAFASPVTFAPGQTFPGTGTGTISSVAAGTGLTGGGVSGPVTLSVDTTRVVTAVTAGTGLTGGGIGGAQTLNLDTTKVPLLSASNTFAGATVFSKPITFATGQTFPGAGTISGVAAGTGLTGGGAAGAVTMSLDTTKVPLLASDNSFAGKQTFGQAMTANGGLSVTGGASIDSLAASSSITAMPFTPATAAAAGSSPAVSVGTSVYNSATSSAVPHSFSWAATPVGNNTASPSAQLNLQFAQGNTTPAATGLSIAPSGILTFAPGQVFPGTGGGTITGVAAGAGLTGGGTNGSVTLNLDTTKVITAVDAGTGLTGGGSGGAQTLSLDATKVPLLAANNNFTGSLSTSGAVNATTYNLNGTLFAYGGGNGNAFLGYAGSGRPATGISNTAVGTSSQAALTSGDSNSAVGFATLYANTIGNSNTAMGAQALEFNSTGSNNDAIGVAALNGNTVGYYNNAFGGGALRYNIDGQENTAIGDNSGPDSGSTGLINATAIGANATVSQNDSLVLGQTVAGSPGLNYVNVGIGTATPATAMEVAVRAEDQLGPTLTLTNPGGTSSTPGYHPAAASIDFKTYLHASTAHAPTSRIEALDDNYGNELSFFVKQSGADSNPLLDQMDITDQGVGISGGLQIIGPIGTSDPPPVVADIGGTVQIEGFLYADSIFASSKDFLIDHPADPANKYLYHNSVESSEMMNIYTGNVVTDNLGLATVKLPGWFQSENADFRYELTTIGRDAHAWVAEEVANNQFKIATNATFVKVSWQITALRQDAYAKAHPLIVEQEKPARERGYYIHPELYGQPQEKQLEWARHPDRMKHLKTKREAALSQTSSQGPKPVSSAADRAPGAVSQPPFAQKNDLPAHNGNGEGVQASPTAPASFRSH
jgi:trimeric autotransporter adhesin